MIIHIVNKDDALKYSHGSDNKILFKFYNKGICCPKCRDGLTYPNKFGYNLLEQLGVDFVSEYKFHNYKLDFYFELNGKMYDLEMDGGLGHKNGNRLSKLTPEETKAMDDERDKLAKENGIEVIRIDCLKSELKHIKNDILHNEKLNELFNLQTINWLDCHIFALSNMVRKICNLYNHVTKDIKEIVNMTKMSKTTIRKYLKQGTELGWCNYDPKSIMIETRKNNGGCNKRKIIQLSLTNEYIAEYQSMSEAESQLNIKNTHISACCKRKRKTAGNFKWMYYKEYIEQQNKSA